jgi:VIT1/CCC1 family predicted Fe2+/Mn2+ transporter
MAARLNWLRAEVLSANDGIVSAAGLVVGAAGASSSRTAALTAGPAGLFAGALAMALRLGQQPAGLRAGTARARTPRAR